MSSENGLSEREMDVLRLVAEGLTNREIAQQLSISHNTVKVHLSNIFEKIGVASRTEATVYAIEHRIVNVPGGEVQAAPTSGIRELVRQFRWIWLAMLILLILIGLTLSTNLLTTESTPETVATLNAADRWQSLAPLPEPRISMAAVAYSGEIFVFGGEGPNGVSGKGSKYLPETDVWFSISDKPTPVTNISAVLIGEKIFIPGGETADGRPTDILEIYDPRQDKWEEGAFLPEALSGYALTGFEGKMYLFGGWDGSKYSNSVWVYDPLDDNWVAGAPLIDGMVGTKALALSDRIILVGHDANNDYLSMMAYYPSRLAEDENPWEFFGETPITSLDFTSTALNDLIFLFSVKIKNDIPDIEFYLFKEFTWESKDVEIEEMEIQDPIMIPIGSQLYFLLPDMNLSKTSFERYQAFYYEIYIPIIN